MRILVNNEVKELVIIDPKTGCNYIEDLVGNADGFDGFDEEHRLDIMTTDTYDWWLNYVNVEEDLQNRIMHLLSNSDNEKKELINEALEDAADSDYEAMQFNIAQVVEKFENKSKE